MDRLAARGLLFERAYCAQAVCSPSRTSLLTGCRPDTTRVYDLETHFRKTLPNVVTLPQHFKANGYHTQAFGKIYHGGLDDPASWSSPLTYPKNEWYQLPENRALMKKRLENLKDDDAKVSAVALGRIRGAPVECADVPDNAYGDGAIADDAIEALRKIKDKPFFLAAGFLKPHLPFVAPKRYWDLYRREEIALADNPFFPKGAPALAGTTWGELRAYHGIPATGPVTDDQARTLIHGYLACVSYVDAQIGRLLDELDRLGLRENTIVVLWGDHGWKLGEHGLWCKHTNFEMDTRSTLIVAAPGQASAGTPGKHTTALTEFVDIYPTLCELSGLPLPQHLEGTSFAPLLETPDRAWKQAAFSQYPRGGGVMGYSMRTDRYRYTQWQEQKSHKVVARELYDHQLDPEENRNVADDPANAKLVAQLGAQLNEGWRKALPGR
ncbi:MAG: sulfatase [Planctomycetota bacterium]|nr:sulfatase [Planctomycetota bacterium]